MARGAADREACGPPAPCAAESDQADSVAFKIKLLQERARRLREQRQGGEPPARDEASSLEERFERLAVEPLPLSSRSAAP
eukprot:5454567-Alexandrium_andersonii.AAC.1